MDNGGSDRRRIRVLCDHVMHLRDCGSLIGFLILSCLSRLPYRLIISNHLCPSHIQRRMNSMVLSSRRVRHKSHGATSLSRSAWQLAIALWSESTTLMRGCCIHALYRKSSKRHLEKLLKSSPSRWVGMHSSYLRRMKRW